MPHTGHPSSIGPYEVLGVLGQGGVGTVYLSEQSAPIRRRVAVKLIRLGMDTKEVLARFALESRALALMDHPNISKVFDAGETKLGRPYFVMEFLDGEPITDYCDRHRLDIQDRLRLFRTVCSAIEHAHQRGIIHRDIKPSNVLVTTRDGSPEPVVIDFGLAKAVKVDPGEDASWTRQGQLLGTPQYMSPEQVESPDSDIDSRADVYALGVLLFELLVGDAPHERPLTPGAQQQFVESVRKEESTRPSSRLSQLTGRITEIAEKRRTDRDSLLRAVRGDLDWVVLKALERDRERRYATVHDLSRDLERYLGDLPVHARPPSLAYRLQRLLSRHRASVAVVIALFVAVILGSAANSYWYLSALSHRDERVEVVRICDILREDLANAHLWFEELLANDQTLSLERDVFGPIQSSTDLVHRALIGEETSSGYVGPIVHQENVEGLRALELELVSLRELTERRWAERHGEGRTGGSLDQEFDANYQRIIDRSVGLVHDIERAIEADLERSAKFGLAVNLMALATLLCALGLAIRFNSGRRRR